MRVRQSRWRKLLEFIKGSARQCEWKGCRNNTASESTWYCVDHWPVDDAICPPHPHD